MDGCRFGENQTFVYPPINGHERDRGSPLKAALRLCHASEKFLPFRKRPRTRLKLHSLIDVQSLHYRASQLSTNLSVYDASNLSKSYGLRLRTH